MLCHRIDAALLLEGVLKEYWEGDDHTNGIYFDETYAYVFNKVFAVRMTHADDVSPLFYKTKSTGIVDKIVDDYPYHNMKKRPQKRHLLLDNENVSLLDIASVFFINDTCYKIPENTATEILEVLRKEVNNRRVRQRSETVLTSIDDSLSLETKQSNRKGILIISEIMSKVNIAPYDFGEITFKMNTNTLYYACDITSKLTDVWVSCCDTKMKIVGKYKVEKKTSNVEIVLSLSKGRG